MNHYPILLNLVNQLVVVIGSGPVGCRKVRGLLKAGARVRLVTLDALAEPELADAVELRQKPFSTEDLAGARLAFAATGDSTVDQAILAAGRQQGVLVNLAAEREAGDFHLPAVLRRGDLLMSVATSGQSPALARVLRDRLAAEYGPEWAAILEIGAALRARRLTEKHEKSYSCKVLENLITEGLPELIAHGRIDAVEQLLTRVLGQEISLAELGLTLRDECHGS